MNKYNALCILTGLILIFSSCTKHLEDNKNYTITEIRRYARNGQIIKSQGVLTDRLAKRVFVVTDSKSYLKIDLSKFKKESKYLDKGTKIIFSGVYIKKPFKKPEIEVEVLKLAEDFR